MVAATIMLSWPSVSNVDSNLVQSVVPLISCPGEVTFTPRVSNVAPRSAAAGTSWVLIQPLNLYVAYGLRSVLLIHETLFAETMKLEVAKWGGIHTY